MFRSIIEMAIPGFMMYLFQGFESSFFEELDHESEDLESRGKLDEEEEEEDSEVFGYDNLTGKQYPRIRKRKPNRYQLGPLSSDNHEFEK